MLATIVVFVVILNIRWINPVDALLDDILDDVSIDMDMLPALQQQDQNIVAATHEKPETTDKINKVDEVVEERSLDDLKKEIAFKPSEQDGLDEMKDSENEPIVPAITNMNGEELPLRIVEELPEFPGGMSDFMTWLTHALKYPNLAKAKKIQGTVMVSFVVEKDGGITNMQLVKKANEMLNQEALRVMRMMPKWKPGKNHGKPCRTVVAVPIVFAI